MATLNDIVDISKIYDVDKFDIFAKIEQMNFISNIQFELNYSMLDVNHSSIFSFEELSYRQFWHRLMDKFENGKPQIFSNSVINHFWQNGEIGKFALLQHTGNAFNNSYPIVEKDLCFRFYKDICRASVSDQYGSILNTQLLEALEQPLSLLSEDYRVIEYHIDRDTLMVKALYKDFNVEDGSYGLGVYIYNDEVGRGALRLGTLIKRGRCDNTTILSNVKTLYHRSNVYERLSHFLPDFSISLKETEQYIINFSKLKNIPLKNFTEEIQAFQKKYQLTTEQVLEFEHGMGEYNLFGWCNGITAMAKLFEGERRTDFEMMAGDIMMKNIAISK